MRTCTLALMKIALVLAVFSTCAWASRTDGSMSENGFSTSTWLCNGNFVHQNAQPDPSCTFISSATKSFGTTATLNTTFSGTGISADIYDVTNCGSCTSTIGSTWNELVLSGAGSLSLYFNDPGTDWGFVGCSGNVLSGEEPAYHCGGMTGPVTTLTSQFLITLPTSGRVDLYGIDFTNSSNFYLTDSRGDHIGDLAPEEVPASTPEPASIALLASGVAAGLLKRRAK